MLVSKNGRAEIELSPPTDDRPLESKVVQLDWLPLLNTDATQKLTQPELQRVTQGLIDLLKTDNFQTLNSVFESVDIQKTSQDVLVSLLRTNFVARSLITNWNDFLNKTKEVLNQRGVNAPKVLKGLSA